MNRSIVISLVAVCVASSSAHAEESLFAGPDIGKDEPVIVDSIGEMETTFRAWASPGTSSKPSKWSAKLAFFVYYPDAKSDDVVLIQVHEGKRKKLGKPVPCSASARWDDLGLAYYDCTAPKERDDGAMFASSGLHTIALTYRKTLEGKDFDSFATMAVTVEQLKKGSQNKPSVSWSESHDMKLWVSTVEEKVANSGSRDREVVNNAIQAAKRDGMPYLVAHTWFKRKKRLERTKMTCMYDGKTVAEAAGVGNSKYSSWSFERKGKPDRIEQNWSQAEYHLHQLHPRPNADDSKGSWATPQHWMNENPGDYKCVITGDGEVLKELHFTVGKDGEIEKPACQLASMNSLRTVTLARAVDKKLVDDVKYDKKAGAKLGYEGRVKWASGCPSPK